MQVLGRGQAQGALQHDLPRCVVGQVLAAHHMGDALRGVVHHHCQLVSPQAISPAQHKVADFLAHVLLLRPQAAVAPMRDGGQAQCGLHGLHIQPPGAGGFAPQTVSAGAGVDGGAVPGHGLGRFDLFARAAAGVGPALVHQGLQGGSVVLAALALPQHRAIGQQAAGCQLLQDGLVGPGHAARCVHVFDAHEPSACVGAGV